MRILTAFFPRLWSDYGMASVLLGLGVLFSILTLNRQYPSGDAAARQVAREVSARFDQPVTVLVVAGESAEDELFARRLQEELSESGNRIAATVRGQPRDARRELDRLREEGELLDVIACTRPASSWLVFANLAELSPRFASTQILSPQPYWWPDFLKRDNLLNIANQISVIAIVAIGMTLVIITAGIDLSVGSLIALSAVTSTLLIRDVAGGLDATPGGMVLCCLAGIALTGSVGAFSGLMVTRLEIPPFIVTLGMMLVAGGTAYSLSRGESISQVPASFVWLGRGSTLFQLPNAAILMLLLYVAAHILTTRTPLGRYFYAVGGNIEAARLSGVPVQRVLLLAYVSSGVLAGLGGVVMASQLKSGSPNYGQMYELYVIAAVVVGGTSLAGGRGKVFGTLIGAFIIAVIQNGMNLTGIESYTQRIVLGSVILLAVCADRWKRSWLAGRLERRRTGT
jgi:ribose transport system permease protein